MSTHRTALEVIDSEASVAIRVAPGRGVIDVEIEEWGSGDRRTVHLALDLGSADELARALRRMIREAEMRERAAETRAAVLGEESDCG